jgi:hypothetical protein
MERFNAALGQSFLYLLIIIAVINIIHAKATGVMQVEDILPLQQFEIENDG